MISVSQPYLGEEEREAACEVLASGKLAQGEQVEHFEQEWARYTGVKYAVAVNNGTCALHLALACLGIEPGGVVITTPFSFVATASSILMQGGTPIFCDIDPVTYNIDPSALERAIDRGARAVIVVHLYGQPCDMDRIMALGRAHGLAVIEDACQAHGAEYKGRKVGSIGDIGVFSFYPTKNMTTGEGGMLTTNDPDIARKARMLRSHGSAQRYRHEFLGYNYRMTEMAAAIGLVQLKKLPGFNARRAGNAAFYERMLPPGVCKPAVMPGADHVFHQYTIRVRNRDGFADYLSKKGIGYGVYYPTPIHKQPMFSRYNSISFPEAEKASREVISLPVHPGLTEEELGFVAEAINSYEDW